MRKLGMKKFGIVLLIVVLLIASLGVSVSAARTYSSFTITITKDVDGSTIDATPFSFEITRSSDSNFKKTGTVSEGGTLKFSKLPFDQYTVTELDTTGYDFVKATINGIASSNASSSVTFSTINTTGTYNVKFYNIAESSPPPPVPTTFHYVALGDSIATGTTSRGTITTYVSGYYNYLKSKYPNATLKNLATDGDASNELLEKLTSTDVEDDIYKTEIKKADCITITIGGNNIMDAARSSYFSSIDNVLAEAGTADFEAQYDQIITTIRNLNTQGGHDARIIVSTLYNPYNSVPITGYTGDPALHNEAKPYIDRINNKIIGNSDENFRIVRIYDHFLTYAATGKMGSITYFYPITWLKFTRDPHPNSTGQTEILNKHIQQAPWP